MVEKVKYFEDLYIWQRAQELTKNLGKIFYDNSFKNRSFQDQIMRASISISNNIAEWFEQKTNKDFAKYLYIAKGSCSEVRSMLYLAKEFAYVQSSDCDQYQNDCRELNIKIYNLIQKLYEYEKKL